MHVMKEMNGMHWVACKHASKVNLTLTLGTSPHRHHWESCCPCCQWSTSL